VPYSLRARTRVLVLLAGLLMLAGCAPAPMLQPPEVAQPELTAPPLAPPSNLQQFYEQELDWSECGPRHECTEMTVPMDYADPDGATVQIAVKVARATGESRGALVSNPGGPGGSGLEHVDAADSMFSAAVLENFDVVGFDPRGVGESDAVRCFDSAELDEYYATLIDPYSNSGWQTLLEEQTAYGEACLERTGPLLGHVDTASTARDMDVLRALLGEQTLTYLGYSYGTYLGAVYAELFPGNVGTFVLDSAMDPSLSYTEVVRGQVGGFDLAYRSYLQDCLAGAGCPFDGGVDEAMQDTQDLLTALSSDPVDTDDPDRPLTDADLFNAIIISLYSVDTWPLLTEAISLLVDQDDPSLTRTLSDFAMERDEDGQYPPDEGAFQAINCLDYPMTEPDQQELVEEAEHLEGVSELFGPYQAFGEVGCGTWPVETDATRAPIAAAGTPPILVIGVTRDPATPYEWAEALADQLESGVLLSYDGDGHGAYGTGNSCVHDLVDAFLLEGQVPDHGTQC